MAKPFDALTKGWPAERLARVDARAKELIAEELTLRDLRKAHELTQAQLAKTLGIGQEHVSRIEQKSDMLLSTLAGYIRGMGGHLRISAEFPGRPQVPLANFADVFEHEAPPRKERRGRKKAEQKASVTASRSAR